MPLHLPEPELPTKRPLPLAADRPTDIRTATMPVGLMPPVTLPPPADHFSAPARSPPRQPRLVDPANFAVHRCQGVTVLP